jgi:hemerythrin
MRPFFQWRDDWLLGCDMLDDKHLELAERMNELYLYLTDLRNNLKQDPYGLKKRLTDLCEATRNHFQEEEALMEAYQYPGLAAHHREHVMLLAEIRECLREITNNNRLFTLENLKSLKYWQIDHVLNSDREFADFLSTRVAPLHEDSSLSAIA